MTTTKSSSFNIAVSADWGCVETPRSSGNNNVVNECCCCQTTTNKTNSSSSCCSDNPIAEAKSLLERSFFSPHVLL